jgi:hypothetical protein
METGRTLGAVRRISPSCRSQKHSTANLGAVGNADLAVCLRALAERVRRNVPLRRDPERFHVEKSCIAQDLEHLASICEAKQERSARLTIHRERRVTASRTYFRS